LCHKINKAGNHRAAGARFPAQEIKRSKYNYVCSFQWAPFALGLAVLIFYVKHIVEGNM